ncbi:MAG TPA: SulP family inorganic anion transporter [Lacipirellulaceae bacterium]|jgi:SulP family sulfate permease|nr:SulP family inorganic anion transporter [Lacipirellulaceae bacterium]
MSDAQSAKDSDLPGSASAWDTLFHVVPAFDSLRNYSWQDLTSDSMAGLTVAAVAVPQAMAYAQIANIPPQYGLYTAIVMTAVGALLDSSKQLINGPTNAISIAVLSALVGFTDAERLPAVFLLALLVGTIQTGISLLRLGDLTKYVSHAVIVGFTLGASVLLVLDQLKNLLGLKAAGTGEDHFLTRFWLTMQHIDQTNFPSLWIGLGTVAIALALRWLNARMRLRLPDLLLALVCMTVIVAHWRLDTQGVKIIKDIPAQLPSFALPEVDWKHVHGLASSAFAVAMLGLLEAISMAKAIAATTRQKLDINQQCLSEGVANVVGSLFHCFPGSGSLTRSTINVQAGGRTQWSGVISAVAVAVTVMLLSPYAYFIPKAGLAGILMLSSWRLVDRKQLVYYLRTTRFDAWIVIITAISAVAISVEFCVLVGVFMSFVMYVPQAARVRMTELVMTPEKVVRERHEDDVPCERIRIFSLEGELFFGAAPELEQLLEGVADEMADGGGRVIILRLKRARNPDAVCMTVLERFNERMHAANISVLLCGLRPEVTRVINSSGLLERLGPERVFVFEETGKFWTSTLEAVRFAYEIVGRDVCDTCPRRDELMTEKDGWYYLI